MPTDATLSAPTSAASRRGFLKTSLGLGVGLIAAQAAIGAPATRPAGSRDVSNLSTPPMERVKVALIGLGNRGGMMLPLILQLDWVDVVALCDKVPEKLEKAAATVEQERGERPKTYGGTDGWKQLCAESDADAVYIATPWDQHTPQCVAAMENGKHALVEVPAALTLDEAWELVETSERTGRHCAMMENCCYGNSELAVLNMVREGRFGTLVHGAGAYIHDLRALHFSDTYYEDQWRLKFCEAYNCNHYPTHGLGPVAWYMDINRGDRFDYMVTVASKQAGMTEYARETYGEDSPQAKQAYKLGDMNSTLIQTANGRSILVQHDVTSPRPYSRINLITGTKGTFEGYPDRMAFDPNPHQWMADEEAKEVMEQHRHSLWTEFGEFARKGGGHGGMDSIMLYRTFDCLRRGAPVDLTVYDAAAWSVLFPLSAVSMSQRGSSVDIPDFTRGAWKTAKPVMSA